MVAMPVHVTSFGIFDTPKIDPFTTTSNNYADVPVHWPDEISDPRSFWPVDRLGGKSLVFTASDKDLNVQILASLDGGISFPITVESGFLVGVGLYVTKYVGDYYHALKIQAKPSVSGQHGTLSVQASGSSLLAGNNYVGKTGMVGFKVSQSFTRPGDTNAYAIDDAISDSTSDPHIMSQDLSSFGASGGRFLVITNAKVISSRKIGVIPVNVVVMPASFAATNDNSEFTISDAVSELGGLCIPCVNYTNAKENSWSASDPGWWEMQLSSTSIYFALQASAAYTPANGEKFTVVMEGFLL